MMNFKHGCYNSCYANSIALRYGYDFSNSTIRRFESKNHENETIEKIESIDSDFVRVGVMGDPSECWGHTIDICNKISKAGKKIVLITKHWETLPEYLYKKVESMNLIINTSISALDNDYLLNHRLNEYNKLKSICKSILRIVSCNFNLNSIYGVIYDQIQNNLFNNENIIDTVLRLSKNHFLIKNNIVNYSNEMFISKIQTATKKNENAFLGHCSKCPDMCGLSF